MGVTNVGVGPLACFGPFWSVLDHFGLFWTILARELVRFGLFWTILPPSFSARVCSARVSVVLIRLSYALNAFGFESFQDKRRAFGRPHALG